MYRNPEDEGNFKSDNIPASMPSNNQGYVPQDPALLKKLQYAAELKQQVSFN
jgi:hypothetical protein